MAFGPESSNPRERRAYAHAKLSQLKQGETTYEEAFDAVKTASHKRKGQASGFAESLGKTAVVLVDRGAIGFQRPGIVHHNFGGYLMPREETTRWTALREAIDARQAALGPRDFDGPDDPRLSSLYNQHNQVHGAYPTAYFTRLSRGEPSMSDRVFPKPGAVVNPAEIADVTPLIAWNNDAAVEAQIAQLQ